MKRTKIKDILNNETSDYKVNVKGWVRSFRNNQFIAVNDGSCMGNLQVVIELGADESLLKRITNGASISVDGTVVPSQGRGQKVEVKADNVTILGDCDPEQFPLQLKNRPSLEYLREIAHLRFRTNTFGAVFRVRHALAFAIHKFFNDRGFVYLHTPIITASDAEGAGEMFRVTTFDLNYIPFRSKLFDSICIEYYNTLLRDIQQLGLESIVIEINNYLKERKLNLTFQSIITASQSEIELLSKNPDLTALKKQFTILLTKISTSGNLFGKAKVTGKFLVKKKPVNIVLKNRLPIWLVQKINASRTDIGVRRFYSRKQFPFLSLSFYNYNWIIKELRNAKDRAVDFQSDFFGRATNLTVSGQLEAELGAMAFSEVYTFGPTFRAENSNTARHLAEFWMIEPEVAFNDIHDNMDLAEDFIRYIIGYAMEHNREDLEFLANRLAEEEKQKPQNERGDLGLIEKLEFVLNNKFERITYTDAVNILLESPANKKKKFQYEVKWGIDLQSEHERYLVEKHFKKPVIVTGYPKEIKAFYMRMNDDGKTVAAMDILAPGIGEIVGGSQREERMDKLVARMNEMHIPAEEMYWYLDTRRFGSVPHAGFGLGFERIVQFVTGMTNIRDVIPFPRTPKNAEF